jgi:hypothetical protein
MSGIEKSVLCVLARWLGTDAPIANVGNGSQSLIASMCNAMFCTHHVGRLHVVTGVRRKAAREQLMGTHGIIIITFHDMP